MKQHTYHPQQDVFRIIDGKKENIEPYRFGYGAKDTQANADLPKKGPYIDSLLFDGVDLVITAINAKGEEVIKEIPAYSGKPRFGTDFDYSKYRQESTNGPIPEGSYFINPQEVQRPTVKDDVVSGADALLDRVSSGESQPIGAYPGGREAWGNCRIPIQSTPEQTAKTGRDNFFIHGGKEKGSAGCIDLLDREKEFCEFLEKYRGKDQTEVPLKVKYLDAVKDVPDDEFDEKDGEESAEQPQEREDEE